MAHGGVEGGRQDAASKEKMLRLLARGAPSRSGCSRTVCVLLACCDFGCHNAYDMTSSFVWAGKTQVSPLDTSAEAQAADPNLLLAAERRASAAPALQQPGMLFVRLPGHGALSAAAWATRVLRRFRGSHAGHAALAALRIHSIRKKCVPATQGGLCYAQTKRNTEQLLRTSNTGL